MNSTLYMEKVSLQSTSSFISENAFYSRSGIVLMSLSIIFNLFAFYLVKRQGFKTFDMWIASFLSIGDAIFITYKLCQTIAFNIIGIKKVFLNIDYGQYDGLIQVFFLLFTASCVACLALLRYWVLCLKKNIKIKIWASVFVFLQFINLLLWLAVFFNRDFILMPLQRYYYPSILSINVLTRFTALYIIFFCLVCLFLVNICYILLAKRFICLLEDNVNRELNYSFYTLKSNTNKQKHMTYIRTGIMLLFYNISMVPFIVTSIKEQALAQLRSHLEDYIVLITFFFFTVINPLTLMVLHDNVCMDLKSIFSSIIEKLKKKGRKINHQSS